MYKFYPSSILIEIIIYNTIYPTIYYIILMMYLYNFTLFHMMLNNNFWHIIIESLTLILKLILDYNSIN